MSTEQPSEAELRAAWEEQLRLLQPADVIVQAVVSLISLAGRRLGVEPGTEQERDLEQVRDAIDGARALMPVLERREDPASLGSLRDALSGLQMEYAKLAGAGAGAGAAAPPHAESAAPPAPEEAEKGGPGPAQRSGRLWIPGS
ncbi:MAG TPA: hypothetical protein VIJ83_04565 [Solirubrobacteraceae bacterium]